MLPWASPIEDLFSRQRGHLTFHRSGRRSAFPVLHFRVETLPFCCGALGCRCLRGPKPALLASQRGLRVRASLTEPPSWQAPCPAGCPASVHVPPTRPAPAPEGVPTPKGRRQVPHPVACLHRGRVVILSRILRRCRQCPRALSASPFVSEDLPGRPGLAPEGVRRRVVGVRLLLRRPRAAWAGGRRWLVRRCAWPRPRRAVRSREARRCDLSWFPRRRARSCPKALWR